MSDLDLERLIAAEDWAPALDAALGEWRGSRDPLLGRVVEAVGTRAAAKLVWPRAKPEFHASWLERAHTPAPAEISPLVEALPRAMPIDADYDGILKRDYARTKYRALLDRIRRLAAWKHADPRVASALTTMVEQAEYSAYTRAGAKTIYNPMVELIAQHGDTGHGERLERLVRSPTAKIEVNRAWFAEALPPRAAELKKRSGTPIAHPKLERWLAAIAPVQTVHTAPPTHGDMAVHADALLSAHGDPRGELIALQLHEAHGRSNPPGAKRIRALLKEHQRTWLGDLAPVLKGVEFREGYLHSAELMQNSAATEDGWMRAAASPVLTTVRVLWKGRGNEPHYQALVGSPHATKLEMLDVPSTAFLEWLLARSLAGQVRVLWFPQPLPKRARELLLAAKTLVRLETVFVAHNEEPATMKLLAGALRGAKVRRGAFDHRDLD